jgi:hypothetical protein
MSLVTLVRVRVWVWAWNTRPPTHLPRPCREPYQTYIDKNVLKVGRETTRIAVPMSPRREESSKHTACPV